MLPSLFAMKSHTKTRWNPGERVEAAEGLILFLLEKGSSVHEANFGLQLVDEKDQNQSRKDQEKAIVSWTSFILSCVVTGEQSQKPIGIILGGGVTRSHYSLVRRLLDDGANILARRRYLGFIGRLSTSTNPVLYVTAFHHDSLFWNANGLQALIDHCDESGTSDAKELLQSCDNGGRWPIHWASAGPGSSECELLEKNLSDRLEAILKLLLTQSP